MKMRKLSAAALALSMLSATTALVASAADFTVDEYGWYYVDEVIFEPADDGTLSVFGTSESVADSIVIPGEIDGKTVTTIDCRYGIRPNITSITIPGTVNYISPFSFRSTDDSEVFNLTDVYYQGTEEEFYAITMINYGAGYSTITLGEIYTGEFFPDDYYGKPVVEIIFGDATIHFLGDDEEDSNSSDNSDSEDTESNSDSENSDSSSATETEKFESGDVTAEADAGIVPEGAELSAELKNSDNSEYTYDIKFVKDGKDVKPDGKVTIKLPLPKALKDKTVYVYYIENGKVKEDMKAKVEGDYVVFTTTHFSEYLLTGEEREVEASTPATGFGGFAMLGVIALAGAAVVVSRKKR